MAIDLKDLLYMSDVDGRAGRDITGSDDIREPFGGADDGQGVHLIEIRVHLLAHKRDGRERTAGTIRLLGRQTGPFGIREMLIIERIGDEDGRETTLFGIERRIKDDADMLFGECTIGQEDLLDMHIIHIIDSYLRGHIGIDGPHGIGSGIDEQITVEGGIERIAGTESHANQRSVFLAAMHDIGQFIDIIAVIEVAAG